MTLPLFPRTSEWVPPASFPDLSDAKEIAIDLETCDPNLERFGPGWPRNDGYIVGYAVAVEGWRGYFPVAHEGGGNLDRGIVERFIRRVLELPSPKIMHNAAYDLGWLLASGFNVRGRVIDTMVAAACIDENRFSYALNALGFDYLKEVKSEQGLKEAAQDFNVHAKKELWKLPAMYVGEYAEQDAALTLKLWQHFKTILRNEEVESIFELESDLLPVLVNITRRGIRFNRYKAQQLIDQMREREQTLIKDIRNTCGSPVDIWAAASIALGFDKLGIQYPRTTNGLPSFTKSFLESHEHPICKQIIEARELNKTHGTFLQPYLDFSAYDGRIHPHINQMRSDDGGTVTGRLSMANPNLQQVPARHEVIGPMVRGLFLPEEGCMWAANDFSSQEPRILIHYAHLLGLQGAEDVVQAYQKDPRTDFYQIVANAANIPRKVAKTCIAEGELVLTDVGLVPIESITTEHRVWDGVEWVNHDGVVFMGVKEVMTYGNLTATPDHDVWTVESGKISFRDAASRLDALVSTGNAEQAIWHVDRSEQGNTAAWKASICEGSMRLWNRGLEALRQFEEQQVNHVSALQYAGTTCKEGESVSHLKGGETLTKASNLYFPEMSQPKRPRLPKIWRAWDTLRIWVSKGVSGIPSYIGFGRRLEKQNDRQNRQQQELFTWEHSDDFTSRKQRQSKEHSDSVLQGKRGLFKPRLAFDKNRLSKFSLRSRLDDETTSAGIVHTTAFNAYERGSKKKVYDILNAGPRNRFTVSGVLVSNCSLGMMYGMGKQKLADSLDLPLDEAEDLIRNFHQNVPFLRGTVDAVMRRIENRASGGAIRTLLGRKCRFPLWEPTEWGIHKALPYEEAAAKYGPRIKRAMTYKGLNRLIQGSAADQTKRALIKLDQAGFTLLLQVHDEIALSVRTIEEAKEAAHIMATAVELAVPSVVDVETGPSWGEAV